MAIAKVGAHGVVTGLSSQANGESFNSGFWSGALSEGAGAAGVYGAVGASKNAQGWGIAYNAVVSGVVGGTVSEISGGSFEQGALNVSMGRLFNELSHVQALAAPAAGLAALDGPLPVGDIAAAGVLIGGYFYGDRVVEWVNDKIRSWNQSSDASHPVPEIKDFWNPTQPPSDGWEWRGKPGSSPGAGPGNWVQPNPDGGKPLQSLNLDLNHPPPVKPHWDWVDPGKNGWRIYPDGSIEKKR